MLEWGKPAPVLIKHGAGFLVLQKFMHQDAHDDLVMETVMDYSSINSSRKSV